MKLKFRLQHVPRKLREKIVQNITADLENVRTIILFKSNGVSHLQFEELRVKLTEQNATLRFLKNTLFKIAVKGKKLPQELYSEKALFGPTGAIFVYAEDFLPALKLFVETFKNDERIEYKVGYIDEAIYEGKGIIAFAHIPSKELLVAKLVWSLKSPLMRLQRSLTYDTSRLAVALKAVSDTKSTS